MNHERFQALYKMLSQKPRGAEAQRFTQSYEYVEYCEHLHTCRSCSDWYMAQRVQQQDIDPAQYPCVHLAYYGMLDCEIHTDPRDCPDVLVIRDERRQTFGLPVRDGGSSVVKIRFCPWCGIEIA
jgi:hypothetical protein